MKHYIQYINRLPHYLEAGVKITFVLDDGTIYEGKICRHSSRKGYYIDFISSSNTIIFDKLGIDDATHFVNTIVGYKPHGIWPETKTLDDLDKVLNALLEVNNPGELEVKEEEVKEEYPSSEWDWLLD